MSAEVINLFGHDRAGLRAALAEMGEKPFRADQLMQWIYRHGVDDFGAMTNLSLSLRDKLAEHCTVAAPEVLAHQESTDGTRKWVLAVGGEGILGRQRAPDRQIGFESISRACSN